MHLKLTWYGETFMLSATKLIKKYPLANHNVQLVIIHKAQPEAYNPEASKFPLSV